MPIASTMAPPFTCILEGVFRYQLAKEYYPDLYERLKRYINEGRWKVAGSSRDAIDSQVVIASIGEEPLKVKALYKALGENLALNKKAKVSQSVDNETPEKAVDGSVDTFGGGNSKWCANWPGEKWLMVDLGKECRSRRREQRTEYP